MTVMEDNGSRVNLKQEGIASMVANDLKRIPSGLKAALSQESLAKKLPTFIANVVYDALAKNLGMLSDVSVGRNPWNEELEQVKEKQDCLLKEMNSYKMY